MFILGKVSRSEGLEEIHLEVCLPQIIRQITELGRKIEKKAEMEKIKILI